jgi:hypothetical protein
VYECFDTGISKMLETGNTHDHCVDRFWTKLQYQEKKEHQDNKDNKDNQEKYGKERGNRFFVFKDKVMYQSCTWSSLQQKPVMQFD